jgi:hypothetical protein
MNAPAGGREGPSPLCHPNGAGLRPNGMRCFEPVDQVRTRSTASPSSGLQLGMQWNASLPVPTGRFVGRVPRKAASHVEPLNRSRRRQSALTSPPPGLCALTSAVTRFKSASASVSS